MLSATFAEKPEVIWLVIAALRDNMNIDEVAQIPDNTMVMTRGALAGMYGPTLMAWMQLVKDEPIAVSAAEPAAASLSAPGGSVAAAAASSLAGARL